MAGNRALQQLHAGAPQSARTLSSDPPVERIAAAVAPAGFILNKYLDVVEFVGKTGRYIELPVGAARLNLPKLLHPELRHPVLQAVREILAGSAVSREQRLTLKDALARRHVNVKIARLYQHPAAEPAIQVLLREVASQPVSRTAPAAGGGRALESRTQTANSVRVKRLKEELRRTRGALESIIEEQESGTGRLRTAYHQLEDLNTELEATNEELALTNAELGALNRRLQVALAERDTAQRERERMEAEIIQTQRLEGLRVMAGGVAHDFNNLLTSILGNATLLLEELPRASPSWDMAEQIEKAGEHASALVRQLLAFCGKGVFATQPLDLSSLVHDSADLLKASISKTAELRFDLAPGLAAIEADPTQVRQVLINLVVNASEAIGGRPGQVSVATRPRRLAFEEEPAFLQDRLPAGDYVCLEVADTGRGMSQDEKGKLFEPFFSTKFAGRGLGLAAVQGIVRGHHGSIEVQSRRGQGTSMGILFPALQRASARPRDQVAAVTPWQGSGMVLVVDDEESVRDLAKNILARVGLEVVTAADGEEAIEILSRQQQRIGLVLLDMVMPRMNGREVLRRLRSICPKIPIVLSSGYSDQKPTASLGRGAPTRFLAKPYRPGDLVAEVRQAMEPETSKVREFPGALSSKGKPDARRRRTLTVN